MFPGGFQNCCTSLASVREVATPNVSLSGGNRVDREEWLPLQFLGLLLKNTLKRFMMIFQSLFKMKRQKRNEEASDHLIRVLC